VPPSVKLTITGKLQVGSVIHFTIHETDLTPPLSRSQASGVASSEISFGDGSVYHTHRLASHIYKRARSYRITVIVTDKAGNTTRFVEEVKIAPAAKPKP
jgi:PKD repeat protein